MNNYMNMEKELLDEYSLMNIPLNKTGYELQILDHMKEKEKESSTLKYSSPQVSIEY